jgi:hypothetical protein
VKVRYAAAGVALSVAVLGLTGCGNGTEEAGAPAAEKIDVKQSAAWMEEADALQYTIGVTGDPAAIKAFAEAGAEDGKISADEQKYLDLLTSVKIIAVGSQDEKAPGSVVVQLDGDDLISVVTSKDDLYLKADADKLPASLGTELEKSGASLTQLAGMLDMFAPGAGDVLRNKWIHLDLAEVYKATGQPRPTPDAAAQAKGQKVIEDLLAKVVVTPDPADPAHQVATVKGADLKATVKELYTLGSAYAGSAAPLAEMEKAVDKAKFPAETKVDLYLDGEKLTKVGLDVTQFDAETAALKQPVNVEISFAEAAPVTVPTGAKDLDLSKLMENFKSMLGGQLEG